MSFPSRICGMLESHSEYTEGDTGTSLVSQAEVFSDAR